MEIITVGLGLMGIVVFWVSLSRGADLADKYLPMTSFWKAALGSFLVYVVAFTLGHLPVRIASWLS